MKSLKLFSSPVTIVLFLVGTTLPCNARKQAVPTITITDERERITKGPFLSSDGKWMTYCTQEAASEQNHFDIYLHTGAPSYFVNTSIWIMPLMMAGTASDKARCLTTGWGTSWSPTWSPDGQKLAFFSDKLGQAALFVWDSRTDKIQSFPQAVVRDVNGWDGLEWSPNSGSVFYKALPQGKYSHLENAQIQFDRNSQLKPNLSSKSNSAVVHVSSFTPGESAQGDSTLLRSKMAYYDEYNDLVMADLRTKRVVRLQNGDGISGISISPNGKYVAFFQHLHLENTIDWQFLYDLYIISIPHDPGRMPPTSTGTETLSARAVNIRKYWGGGLTWSPSSDQIAYATGGHLADGHIHFVTRMGKTPPYDITRDFKSPPAWTTDRNALLTRKLTEKAHFSNLSFQFVCSVTKDKFLIKTSNSAQHTMGFAYLDTQTGAFTQLSDEPKTITSINVAGNTGRVAFIEESSTEPPGIWSFDAYSGRYMPRQLTESRAQLSASPPPAPNVLTWTTRAGRPNKGLLFLPESATQQHKAPMIVFQYPGMIFSDLINHWSLYGATVSPSVFTNHGYAILFADCPMNTNDPTSDIVSAVVPGVDAAVATGMIDGSNIGIMGHSFGGYAVAALVTHSTRFNAAVDVSGLGDIITDYLESGDYSWAETGQANMGATLWQQPERYIRNSPAFALDKVQTPLLLIVGEADELFPQSNEIYNGLVRLNKEVSLVTYPNAGHSWETWTNAQQTDFWTRIFAWFDGHLHNDNVKPTLNRMSNNHRSAEISSLYIH